VTQHIPEKGEHLVRYFGWYSHRQRGIRKKARPAGETESGNLAIDRSALDAENSATEGPRPGSMSTWAMLIKRVYEVDPSYGTGRVISHEFSGVSGEIQSLCVIEPSKICRCRLYI